MNSIPPPKLRSSRRKIVLLALAGLLVSAMLLLVVLNIDRSPEVVAHQPVRDLTGIETPPVLSDDELQSGMQVTIIEPHAMGAERGWIQVNGPDGKLSRQYRFEALDPLPNGWSKMTKPHLEARFGDDRVVTLESDTAMIYTPGKEPASGTLTGSVNIRAYALEPGEEFDPATSIQLVHISTPEALFDNTRSEIRCDGQLRLQTPSAQLEGSGLRLLLNELEQRAEWMHMKQATVRIANGSVGLNASNEVEHESAEPPAPHADESEPTKKPRARGKKKKQGTGPAFYRLTFEDNVRITQAPGEGGWQAHGDELAIVFSMKSKSLGRAFAMHHDADFPMQELPATMLSTAGTLATLALASTPHQPTTLFQQSEDDIVITCDGGISMLPLSSADLQPASVDEMRLELVGSPLRMTNPAEGAVITGRTLTYQSPARRIEVFGNLEHPLTLESPELRVNAPHLWFDQATNAGAFEGAGSMLARDRASPAGDSLDSANDIRIDWKQRVALEFDPPEETPDDQQQPRDKTDAGLKLRLARFMGDVEVTNPDLTMRADAMDVTFPAMPSNSQQSDAKNTTIESILASGHVRASSVSDGGELKCESLHLNFAHAADGRTAPDKLIATQNVEAVDREQQIVWCDRFEVTFDAADGPEGRSDTSPREAAAVKAVHATSNVQALLANGARAFADTLEADPSQGLIVLTGEKLMIASDRAFIHRGQRIEIRQEQNKVFWPGGGEFVYLASPVVPPNRAPVPQPSAPNPLDAAHPPHVLATWSESMTYDAAFDQGAGQITLRGTVNATSDHAPNEHNTLQAEALTLQFERQTSSVETSQSTADDASRRLKMMIAQGKDQEFAKIENHTWINADRSGTPRIFYIAGQHIEFNDAAFEAHVKGPGEMLVSDRGAGDDAPPPAQPPQPVPAISAKGDTSFRWSDHFQIKQRGEREFDINMQGGIFVIHEALDKSITKITCKQLSAVAEREQATQAAPPREKGIMEFGGAMMIQSLRGAGNVYIDAPTRDIDCAEFEYDNRNGIATLLGPPGGTVAVTTQGDAMPLRAARIVWNLKEDKVTATDISGAPSR